MKFITSFRFKWAKCHRLPKVFPIRRNLARVLLRHTDIKRGSLLRAKIKRSVSLCYNRTKARCQLWYPIQTLSHQHPYLQGGLFRRLCWTMAFLFLGFWALRDISQLMTEFYRYPILVDVRLKESRRLPFPAVTVCNLNVVRYSALCSNTRSFDIPNVLRFKLCGIQDTNDEPTILVTDDENSPGQVEMPPGSTLKPDDVHQDDRECYEQMEDTCLAKNSSHDFGENQQSKVKVDEEFEPVLNMDTDHVDQMVKEPFMMGGFFDEVELTEREEKELQANLTNWLAVTRLKDRELVNYLGHQFEDFILRCTMKSRDCTHQHYFVHTFTPTEGNCFTYKPMRLAERDGSHELEEASFDGVNYGLELVLHLEKSEYLPGSAQIGALVMVHHPNDSGVFAGEAVVIAPDEATYIGVRYTNTTRLPPPHPENCTEEWPEGLNSKMVQTSTYSQQACLKICLQKAIMSRCKCQSAMFPQLNIDSKEDHICDIAKQATHNCVKVALSRIEDKVDACICPPKCQVIKYDKTVSSAKWPSRQDRMTFDKKFNYNRTQNLAKVIVYFRTMISQEVTQQRAYTMAKLFSGLGGIMGMYVGLSFFSLFKVLEVVLTIGWNMVFNSMGANQPS